MSAEPNPEFPTVLAAYLANNPVPPADIPQVAAAIREALDGKPPEAPSPAKPTNAQIKASITPDYLVSFEDGKRYKVLTRHLNGLGMTAAQYREKWGLPPGYPVVAATFSERRAELAREHGLGQKGRGAPKE